MQRNAEECREMERNAEKFRELQRNAENCREMVKDSMKLLLSKLVNDRLVFHAPSATQPDY